MTTDLYIHRRAWTFVATSAWLMLAGLAHCTATAAQPKSSPDKPSPGADSTLRGDDDAPRANRTLKITVLGPDRQPLPKARIHAAIWAKEPAKSNRDYVCDEHGETVVELPRQIEILRLFATFDGHVGLFAHWWPRIQKDGAEIPEEFTFQLEKGTVIGGLVENEDGQPIKGAKVQVTLARKPGNEHMPRLSRLNALAMEDRARVTDEQGRWTLDNVPAGDDVSVILMLGHPDYISDAEGVALPREQNVTMETLRARTALIVMHRGVSLTGTVKDADGKPVANAVVIWGDDPYGQSGSQEVRTDAKGNYRLPPLPDGPMTVTVVAQDWAPDQQRIDIAPDQPPVDFQLARGKKVRIRFVDEEGKAIAGVGVGIDGWRGGKALYNFKHSTVLDTKIPTVADKQGIYEWDWAPSDAVSYFFGKLGYARVDNVALAADDDEFVVTLLKGEEAE